VTPELVRLSVGIEDVRDIIADLEQGDRDGKRAHVLKCNINRGTLPHNECSDRIADRRPARWRPAVGPAVTRFRRPRTRATLCSTSTCCWSAGGTLDRPTLHYAVYGRLNAERDNAVLVCHALSGSAQVGGVVAELFCGGRLALTGARLRDLREPAGFLLRFDGAGSVDRETGVGLRTRIFR